MLDQALNVRFEGGSVTRGEGRPRDLGGLTGAVARPEPWRGAQREPLRLIVWEPS